ncbi:hypothetical protein RvY_06184 [Ramazzottius varieornatus]|uniref:Uncharacterized protein n=1 Tax=Ramazzottius varieornatus TaxID=947166 RepID=A0A1D1V179_RAMVA|nr:hypothetical protein RvY_06184 [Ramazzottius varieornatus]
MGEILFCLQSYRFQLIDPRAYFSNVISPFSQLASTGDFPKFVLHTGQATTLPGRDIGPVTNST